MARWITAEEAQGRLGVKLQTLYAYTSRGLIANRADAADPRRSLYAADDIARLMVRKMRGRRASVAHEAMSFGEPVLSSAITTISGGRLYYRGQDAAVLAETASLEDVARLLWGCTDDDPFLGLNAHPVLATGPDSRARAFSLLALRAATDPAISGRSDRTLRREAASLLTDLVDAMCGQARTGAIHDRLARTWRVEGPKVDAIRRALVLTADHELNASTFAARVTASTGATLAAGALAGLAALSGPLHGGMTAQVTGFIAEVRRASDPREAAMQRLAQGLEAPGFGHPLYPHGDPRAAALGGAVRYSDEMQKILRACEGVTGAQPNLDFALVAMSRTLGLPADAPFALFTIGRAAGWIAHMLEQRASGAGLIRPRARYVGPAPGEEAEDETAMISGEAQGHDRADAAEQSVGEGELTVKGDAPVI
jgi:citrate synthase